MIFLSVSEISKKWNISTRRVRILAEQGRIFGAVKKGTYWKIPYFVKSPDEQKEIETKLNRIEKLRIILGQKRPLTVGEVERLNSEFAIEYTFNTNAIEGNTLTLQETAWVLEGMTVDKKLLKCHLEAIGHKEAFDYVLEIVKEKKPIDEQLIKQIHSMVLADRPLDKGVYRKTDVRILGAKHTPTSSILIQEQMNKLIEENSLLHILNPIVNVSIFHIIFEQIHPFIDGNGRTGRLLINYGLLINDFPAIDIKFADRQKYYKAFDEFHEGGNIFAMINLIADAMIERLEQIIMRISG